MGIRSAAAAAVLLGLSCLPAAAQRVQVGTLTCNVGATVGVVVGSRQNMRCTFRHSEGRSEIYRGTITRVGLDIGFKTGGRLIWGVLATGPYRKRAITGSYAGASAEVSAGAGVGANALVGGFGRSIVLQPLSVQGQEGANLALGVAEMSLR